MQAFQQCGAPSTVSSMCFFVHVFMEVGLDALPVAPKFVP